MPTMASFPLAALLPKKETHADKFLAKHPEFDGRGVKVAVFDTGVDPGAIGLQTTTLGSPKITEIIDCSGAGDVKLVSVETGKVVLQATSSVYELTGLSGRKLRVPSSWVKCEGSWQLGLKRAYELWPKDLTSRIKEERKRAFFEKHHEYESRTQSELVKIESTKDSSDAQKNAKKDIEGRLAALKSLRTDYNDEGPVYDCVVFKPDIATELDKTSPDHLPWAALDTSETGNLSNVVPMHAYHHQCQFGVFSDASLMSYSFNFYDDDILSISVVSGTHGTHVAGIIAAHHPDQPELNGLAPGAQIVSMTIGDGRLGSLETSQSFMRAMNFAIKLGVDVINISYGEDSHFANDGPLMTYMRDIVIRKHKITVVSSAGNNGPGYSSIGAPGGMTSSIISVGAYVSQEMATAQYALRDEAGNSAYTWSSRGPSIDGDKGVSIFAPGAAITCVPPYALNRNQLMNGTSMSSPNAAGGVALIVSGLKARGISYSPATISRSLLRTSIDIGDEFKTGLMSVAAAYEDLLEGDGLDFDVYFDLVVNGNKRGIVLREESEVDAAQVFSVEIKPRFQQNDTKKKFEFELFSSLECEHRWLEFSQFVHLNNTGRALQVKVDPTMLTPGLHVTSIKIRSTTTNKVVFEIPVTVVKPLKAKTNELKQITFNMKFKPGKIERRYLAIPTGVHGCTIRTSTSRVSTPIQLWTHINQFLPDVRRTWTSSSFVQNLTTSIESEAGKKTISLVHGTAEFCFAQFWSSVSDECAEVTVSIEFHGITADFGKELHVHGGNGYKQIIADSTIGNESLKPSVRLDMLRRHLRPSSCVITPLGSRDVLDDTNRLYSMIMQYSIKFSRAGESMIALPMSGTLYENPWYSAFIQVFDEKKNLVYFTSTYPEKHKFEKKSYTILVELVHKDKLVLEKMKDQLIMVDSAIEKEITLDIYDNFFSLWNRPENKWKAVKLNKGASRSFVIPSCLEIPKEASVGDILVGAINLNDHKELKSKVFYTVPPSASLKQEEKKPKTLVQLQIDLASKIVDKDEKTKYLDGLIKENPKDLQVVSAQLKGCREDQQEYVANSAIDLIDEDSLARYYGVTRKPEAEANEAEKEESEEMARKKELLASAYSYKLLHMSKQSAVNPSEESKKSLDEVLTRYLRWTDSKTGVCLLTQAKSFLAQELYGRSLNALLQASKVGDLTSAEEDEVLMIRQQCLEKLEWTAWLSKDEEGRIGKDPSEYRPF